MTDQVLVFRTSRCMDYVLGVKHLFIVVALEGLAGRNASLQKCRDPAQGQQGPCDRNKLPFFIALSQSGPEADQVIEGDFPE